VKVVVFVSVKVNVPVGVLVAVKVGVIVGVKVLVGVDVIVGVGTGVTVPAFSSPKVKLVFKLVGLETTASPGGKPWVFQIS
jgi:hypothetical protein